MCCVATPSSPFQKKLVIAFTLWTHVELETLVQLLTNSFKATTRESGENPFRSLVGRIASVADGKRLLYDNNYIYTVTSGE